MSWASTIAHKIIGWIRYLCIVILSGATLAGCILLFFDLAHYFFSSSDFTVQEISITPTQWIDKQEIIAQAEIPPDSNIWMISLDDIRQKVESLPHIDEVKVQRIPPRRIHLVVKERVPVAYALNNKNNLMYGLDQEGVILSPFRPETLNTNRADKEMNHLLSHPLISGLPAMSFVEGEVVESDSLQLSLKFLESLRHYATPFFEELAEVEWREDGNLVLHPRRRIGVLVLRNDYSQSIALKINALWSAMEREDLRAIYVDARFPEKGFAVRWDESEGQEWKRLYQKEGMAITSRVQNG